MIHQKTPYIIICILLAIGCYQVNPLNAQSCDFPIDTIIPDLEELFINIQIDGAVQNDLSDPAQGLCFVNLEFNHQFLGDLEIRLISPAGQEVILIGPTGTFGQTDFTSFNISFVNCASPASPDAGFAAVWDNDQMWGIFGNYSGTYYPNSGCLEDFNMGPVNGNWLLIIEDNGLFDDGNLINVELIFCDPAGISCSQCEANGSFIHPGSLSYCEKDTSIIYSLDPLIDLDTSVYSFQYLLIKNDTVINYLDTIDFNALGPSDYQICGFSILNTDLDSLPSNNNRIPLPELTDYFDGDNKNLCGNISTDCFQITVLPAPDTIYIEESICFGDTLRLLNQAYTFEGEYLIDVDQTLCDTAIVLLLSVDTLEINFIQSDSLLNCAINSITISALNSMIPDNSLFNWTTINGNIVSSPDSSQIIVDQAGKYLVQVNGGACSVLDSVDIMEDISPPQYSVIRDTINCTNTIANLMVDAQSVIDSVLWSGPSIIGDPGSLNIQTDQAGLYSVSVFGNNQCISQADIEIISDINEPAFTIDYNDLNCRDSTSQLEVGITSGEYTFSWTGDSGLDTITQNLQVDEPGKYTLEVININNGCNAIDSIVILSDTIKPLVSFNVDTLTCTQLSIFPNLSPLTPLDSIHWNGPANFESIILNPELIEPGVYEVQLFGSNHCFSDTLITVQTDTTAPTIQLSADTLDCMVDSLQITLISPDSNDYSWMGSGAFSSIEKSPFVFVAGTYYVEAVGENGCISQDSITIESSEEQPQVTLFHGTLNCVDTLVTIQVSGSDSFEYQWTGPAGFMSMEKEPDVELEGVYTLDVLDPGNGCLNSFSTEILIDTIPVRFDFESAPLNCTNTSTDLTIIPDRGYLSITWLGPMGFSSIEDTINIFEPGEYVAVVIGENLCVTFDTTTITIDTIPPNYMLEVPAEITCQNDSIEVMASSVENVTFQWTGPSSFSSTNNSFFTSVPGHYDLRITGTNGCSKNDSVTVIENRDTPQISTFGDTLDCEDIFPEIGFTSLDSFQNIQWIGPGNFNANTDVINPDLPGDYFVDVTGFNGCIFKDTVFFAVDTLKPTAVIETSSNISCGMTELVLSGENSSIGPNFSYLWSSSNGNIISGTDSISSIIDQEGIYQLTVFDNSNACESSTSFIVENFTNEIQSVEFVISPVFCLGENSGSLEILAVNGGAPRYRYSIQPGSIQTEPIFQMLSAGQYTLNVRDSLGCSLDTVFNIPEGRVITLEPLDTLYLNPGEIVTTTLNTNVEPGDLDTIIVSPGSGILNQNEYDIQLQAFNDTQYNIQLIDLFGCTVSAPLVVFVNTLSPNVYVPNAFSPNDDGFNDQFVIFTSNVQFNIVEYVIYDRWGNQLYQARNFNQNQSEFYWDGRKNGEKVLPGVYVYLILIEFEDGTERRIKGTVTLIR